MSITQNDTMATPEKTVHRTGEGTEQATSGKYDVLFDGIRTALGVVTVLRGFPLAGVLGVLKLVRRTGPLGSVAVFGAGVAVGTGVGVLFAPMSGAEMRRKLRTGAKDMGGEAKRTILDAEHKAEELAGKAKDSVISAEHEIEHKVVEGLGVAKEVVKNKAESAAHIAHDLVDNVKSAFISFDRDQQKLQGRSNGMNGAGKRHTVHVRS